MTTISHKNLTGNQLHENKGVSAATDGTVATASSGATVWQKLTAANLTGTGNSFGSQLLHIARRTSSDGSNLTINAWNTRTLDTVVTNEISGASLATNQITLAAGTYYLDAVTNTFLRGNNVQDGLTQTRLRNITAGTTTLLGLTGRSNGYNLNGGEASSSFISPLSGRFTIAGSTVFEIQQWCKRAVGGTEAMKEGYDASSGELNVYADVQIWKIA